MKSSTKAIFFLVALAVGASALSVLSPQDLPQSPVARILLDGELVEEIALDKVGASYSFTVEDGAGGSNTILVEQGRIRVSEANCPDQVCVDQGWISNGTVPIVCLPHKLMIQIVGGGEALDAATG